ncbi:MAG TPA: hypothetical protein VES88_07775 [Gemmatimonadaceae bacterium]|nr:hypothetical protein [Gemmatimonadaceae bacterium]
MQIRILSVVFAFSLALAPAVSAQGISPQCPPGSFLPNGEPDNTKIAQDACQKAIDLFQYMAPQLGALLAGGNATQGLTGTLGGLGHFVIGLRGNAIRGSLPEVDKFVPATEGAQQITYTVTEPFMGLPTGDAAIGIFGGLPLGLTRIGGLDLLLSASYLPNYNNASVDVAVPAGSWKFGYGAKLGILQESLLVPGVSVSFLTRELPLVRITGRAGEDRLVLDSIRVKTNSWRAVAGKGFLFFGGAVGVGQDTYDSNASISVFVAPRPASEGGSGGPIALQQKLTRTNYFASLWINAQILRIVGEFGQASGGEILTYNQFTGSQPDEARPYFSVGVSLGW